MSEEFIKTEIDGAVATITLNRPDAANGMHIPLTLELLSAATRVAEDRSVRAVILTGAGKMFSAGGDLRSFESMGANLGAGLSEMTAYLHGAISRLARMEKPLITAINGTAAGAGMSLAVAGDIAIAARSAKFTMAYTAAGLTPDGSSTFFIPRLIGLRKTQELMLTNRALSADEACAWGLVTSVSEDDALASEARALADKLAAGPTRAYAGVRKLLAKTFDNGLEAQMEDETQMIVQAAGRPDGQEGIAAFLAKRRPAFTGE